jgi:hypothetical protein
MPLLPPFRFFLNPLSNDRTLRRAFPWPLADRLQCGIDTSQSLAGGRKISLTFNILIEPDLIENGQQIENPGRLA